MSTRPYFFVPVLALLAVAGAAPVSAADSYDNCSGTIASLPATITTQGTWCLKGDLATGLASGNAITVATNNVTIECNGFKIGGLNAGPATQATGIAIVNRLNTTVRGCNIRGFQRGIGASGGAGHLIEDSRFEANTLNGISVASAHSIIRNNVLMDTGGSPAGFTSVIYASGGVGVLDNRILGATESNSGVLYGIYSTSNDEALIRGNWVSGLMLSGGISTAIAVVGSQRNILEGNFLSGSSVGAQWGITCMNTTSSAVRNVIVGMSAPMQNCTTYQNSSNTN